MVKNFTFTGVTTKSILAFIDNCPWISLVVDNIQCSFTSCRKVHFDGCVICLIKLPETWVVKPSLGPSTAPAPSPLYQGITMLIILIAWLTLLLIVFSIFTHICQVLAVISYQYAVINVIISMWNLMQLLHLLQKTKVISMICSVVSRRRLFDHFIYWSILLTCGMHDSFDPKCL